jgi:hypothetical protein
MMIVLERLKILVSSPTPVVMIAVGLLAVFLDSLE